MKYPKTFLAGIFLAGLSFFYMSGRSTAPSDPLRDSLLQEFSADVKGSVEALKKSAAQSGQSLEGKAVAVFPVNTRAFKAVWKRNGEASPMSDARKYECQDEKGNKGYNKITVKELLASKVGECSIIVDALKRESVESGRQGEFLKKVDLKGANLRGAQLYHLNMSDAQLQGADLTSSDLSRAWLTGANFEGAVLENVAAHGVVLRGAVLDKANLKRSWLAEAILSVASLKHADATDANFLKADLFASDLFRLTAKGLNAEAANLSGTKMDQADFSDANLADSNLDGADMRGANLSGAKLLGAHYNITTQFPALFNLLRKKEMRDN